MHKSCLTANRLSEKWVRPLSDHDVRAEYHLASRWAC